MKVLEIDGRGMKPVTDAMWEEYLAAPLPEGFEATGEVRNAAPGEHYLNPVNVWSGLEPEAIFLTEDEDCLSGYTHFRINGELRTVDEPPVARRILRRIQ